MLFTSDVLVKNNKLKKEEGEQDQTELGERGTIIKTT